MIRGDGIPLRAAEPPPLGLPLCSCPFGCRSDPPNPCCSLPCVEIAETPTTPPPQTKRTRLALTAFLNTAPNRCKKGWVGGSSCPTPPQCVTRGCPKLSHVCDKGRETFCLSSAVKTRPGRDTAVGLGLWGWGAQPRMSLHGGD